MRVVGSRHPGFALRAIEIVKDDTRTVVLFLNLVFHTADVINMTTFKMDTWLLTKA